MTLKEIQIAWNEQAVPPVDQSTIFRQVTKARHSMIGGILVLAAMLLTGTLTFWQQVERALADNAYTFANSYLDMAVTLAGVLMVLRGLVYVLRMQRELRNFKDDTWSCLELLIHGLRDDVRSIRRHLPIMLGGLLLLGLLSRLQLILGGVGFNDGWAELILVGIGVLMVYAFFRYRLQVHVRPRLEALEAVRRELAGDSLKPDDL
mgnify:CR=1 FL=1